MLVETAGGLGRGGRGVVDARDHETEKRGIHARNYLFKEEETKAEDLGRAGNGEKEMEPNKPKT